MIHTSRSAGRFGSLTWFFLFCNPLGLGEASLAMPECRVAVLGLSGSIRYDSAGTGKSSLCSRFVRPEHEEFARCGEDHGSAVSMTDFDDFELNGDHYVYFGKARRDYLPPGAQQRVPLVVHVVEHTEFVDDACYRPLGTNVKPYQERATTAKLSSPGKVSYRCHSDIGDRKEEREEFPIEFSAKGVDGYIFVLDPTSSSEMKRQQMKLLDTCLARLPKNKPVVVTLTKCDTLSPAEQEQFNTADFDIMKFFTGTCHGGSMRKKQKDSQMFAFHSLPGKLELRKEKKSIPVFCVSARDGVGVDAPFLFLAHTVLCLHGSPPRQARYSKLLVEQAKMEACLLSAMKGLMQRCVSDAGSTWTDKQWSLRENTDFRQFEEVYGKERSRELFCARLVELNIQQIRAEATRSSELSDKMPPLSNSSLEEQRKPKGWTRKKNQYTKEPRKSAEEKQTLARVLSTHPDLQSYSRK